MIQLTNGVQLPETRLIQKATASVSSLSAAGRLEVMQYDDTLPLVAVTLTNRGIHWAPPAGATLRVRMGKPDGKGVLNDALGTDENGAVYFAFTRQMTAADGMGELSIQVETDEGVKSSAILPVTIRRSPVSDDKIESGDEYQSLAQILDEAGGVIQQAGAAADTAAQQADAAAQQADAAAQQADQARQYAQQAGEQAARAVAEGLADLGFPKIRPLRTDTAVPNPTGGDRAGCTPVYGSNYEVSLQLLDSSGYGIVGFALAESYQELEDQEIIAVVKNIGQSPVDTTLMLTNSTTAWNNADQTVFRLTDFRLSLNPGQLQTISFVPSDYRAKYQAKPQADQRFCVLAAKYYPADSNTQDLLLCFYNATQFARYQGFDSDRILYPLRAVEADLADGVTDTLRQALVAEVAQQVQQGNRYITCWGDSLTARGGWTTTLQNLCGMPVYNGGTGGEPCRTILARQGGDVMVVNDLQIPAQKTPVVLANRSTDKGIMTWFGNHSTPLLQGGTEHVNPCLLGTVEGTLAWTGASFSDQNGTWTFTRSTAGDAVTIDRPTALRTNFDRSRNAPYLMILFMGQNGGYTSNEELVWQHQRMVEHAQAEHVLVLGFSTGSASSRSAYEKAMQQAFGRYFLSLRQYLAHPIYDGQGTEAGNIVSCYGLADAGLTPTAQDLEAIGTGTVPPQCTLDGIHYTTATQTVIGKLIYNYCRELNLF